MALKEQLTEQEPKSTSGQLSDSEEKDLSIMVNLAKNLIDDGGLEVVKSAEQSSDPGQVIGQFLMQLGMQLSEKLSGMVDISPRIMLAEGGWVEQVSDYLQEEYGVPKNTMDRAEIYVGTTVQQMPQQGAAPNQAQPLMPQPASPEGGM